MDSSVAFEMPSINQDDVDSSVPNVMVIKHEMDWSVAFEMTSIKDDTIDSSVPNVMVIKDDIDSSVPNVMVMKDDIDSSVAFEMASIKDDIDSSVPNVMAMKDDIDSSVPNVMAIKDEMDSAMPLEMARKDVMDQKGSSMQMPNAMPTEDEMNASVHMMSNVMTTNVSVYSSQLGTWCCRLRILLDDGDNTDIYDEWLAPDERLLWDIMQCRNAVKHQRERFHTKPDDPVMTLEREKVPQVTVQVLLNLVTKSISPQFHDVVFDDMCTSVHCI